MIYFTKEQILKTKRFAHRRDLLGVLLADGESYSFEDCEALLDSFMMEGED